MHKSYTTILAGICWFGAALPALAAAVIPDCAGGVEIRNAKIMRVERNGALILTDGRAVLLEGIRLPLEQAALAEEALRQLRALAMAQPLTLTSTPPKQDRYDRVREQAFGNVWLQMELIRRGLARVQMSADRSECAPDLYEAEQAARAARTALWASSAFGVRTPDSPRNQPGTFQIVEGRVANVSRRDGRILMEFVSDNRRSFTAIVAPDDTKAFRNLDPPITDLRGRRIRIRGIVQDNGGRPLMALANPAQIELFP